MRKPFNTMTLFLAALIVTQGLRAAPEPATVPVSWQLTFRYQDPQRVSILLPGRARPVVYWYMLYTVENPTGREVDFYPEFDLVTDTLKVVRSEIGVSPEAYRAVERRSGDPLLVPPEKASGLLRRGKDQARHSVAIWRDFDAKARAFKVYVSGLSGEVKRLNNPAFDTDKEESETNKREFLLRKTLEIPYRFPGSERTRPRTTPERVTGGQKWIMR